MAPTIEIAVLEFAIGSNYTDPSTTEGKVLEETLSTISRQQGMLTLYWGPRVETPIVADLVIIWGDVSDHERFMKSTAYTPFLERLRTVLNGPPDIFHVEIPTDETLAVPLIAPVTEVLTSYTSLSKGKSEFESAVAEFSERLAKDAKGFLAATGGWALEQAQHNSFSDEGGEGRRFVAFIGWKSIDVHMKYRDTQEFKDAIPLLRNSVKGIEMHHVKFRKY